VHHGFDGGSVMTHGLYSLQCDQSRCGLKFKSR
jgi:hypothetical protein